MSKAAGSAIQLVLFESDDRSQTNLIALYDLAPRFVFPTQERGAKEADDAAPPKDHFVKSRRRTFSVKGHEYTITLQPARLYKRVANAISDESAQTPHRHDDTVGPGEVEVECFPGEREQIVEQVVRRLAMDRNRLTLAGEKRETVRVHVSLYEIKRELAAVNRSLNTSQIREALEILARSRMIIARASDEAGSGRRPRNLLESTAFPSFAVRAKPGSEKGDGDDADTYLDFNPLVSAAIRELTFQPISYEWLMRLKSPISRWLYNRLSIEYEAAVSAVNEAGEVRPVALSATEIIRNSGINEWSRRRDTLRYVSAAVDALVDEGILVGVDKQLDRQGRRIDDIDYVMFPSRKFLEQVRRAETSLEANAATFKAVTGADTRPEGFVEVTAVQAAETRSRRIRRVAAVQDSLPLIDNPE